MSDSRITSLGQFVAAVPYLVGYHPADAVAMVTMHEGRVIMTAVWREPVAHLIGDPQGLVSAAMRAREAGATTAAVFAFDAGDEGRDRAALIGLACEAVGMEVRARAEVTGGAVLDLDDPDKGWQEVPPPPLDVAAERAMAGIAPMNSREDIARSFEPTETDDVAEAVRAGTYSLREGIAAWTAILDTEGEPVPEMPAETIAAALSMLAPSGLRDGLLWRVIPATPEKVTAGLAAEQLSAIKEMPEPSRSTSRAVETASRLRQVCTRTPIAHSAGILTATASLYWWGGDGARAEIALTRALSDHPGYTLAKIMHDMVGHGIRLQAMEDAGAQ